MKKVLLVGLVALLGLIVASPSLASGGRPGHAQAHIAKKCKKKHGKKKKCKKKKPVVTVPTPAPTPNPLTDPEVINQIIARAAVYCADDSNCVDYGYYFDGDPSHAACETKSTYTWSCYGWNDEDFVAGNPNPDATCDFREIVERVGIDGITSHQDLSFGGSDGFNCFDIP
jgi:hypothetical protein